MITDSPDEPGVPFVYRTPEERAYNLQRLNLDKLVKSVEPNQIILSVTFWEFNVNAKLQYDRIVHTFLLFMDSF